MPKPMAKYVPLTITMRSDLVNEQGTPPQVETANIRETKSIAYSISDLDLENIKKLISKYGVPDNGRGKPLVFLSWFPDISLSA